VTIATLAKPAGAQAPASSTSTVSQNEAGVRDAAQQFESFLLKQMLRELRASSLSEPQDGSSQAYREMADDLMADHLAKSGAFGFGKAMADQMLAQIRQSGLKAHP
jgi:Rod binding domain-containing protein